MSLKLAHTSFGNQVGETMPSLTTNNSKRPRRIGTYEYIMFPSRHKLQSPQYFEQMVANISWFFLFNLTSLFILLVLTTAADDILWYIYYYHLNIYLKYELYYADDYYYYIFGLTVTYSFTIVFLSDLFYDIIQFYIVNNPYRSHYITSGSSGKDTKGNKGNTSVNSSCTNFDILFNPKLWLILSTCIIFHTYIAGVGLYEVVHAFMTQSSKFVYHQMFSFWCDHWLQCFLFDFGYVYILFIIPFVTPLCNLLVLYLCIKCCDCLMVTPLEASDININMNNSNRNKYYVGSNDAITPIMIDAEPAAVILPPELQHSSSNINNNNYNYNSNFSNFNGSNNFGTGNTNASNITDPSNENNYNNNRYNYDYFGSETDTTFTETTVATDLDHMPSASIPKSASGLSGLPSYVGSGNGSGSGIGATGSFLKQQDINTNIINNDINNTNLNLTAPATRPDISNYSGFGSVPGAPAIGASIPSPVGIPNLVNPRASLGKKPHIDSMGAAPAGHMDSSMGSSSSPHGYSSYNYNYNYRGSRSYPRKKSGFLINKDSSIIGDTISEETTGMMEDDNYSFKDGNTKNNSNGTGNNYVIRDMMNSESTRFEFKNDMNLNLAILDVKQIGLRNLKLSIVKLLLGYFFIWFIFGFIGYFYFEAPQDDFFYNHWEKWYLGWLAITSVIKFLLKMIARQIDRQRIKIRLLWHCYIYNYRTRSSHQSHSRAQAQQQSIRQGQGRNNTGTPNSGATTPTSSGQKQVLTKDFEIFSMEWFTELIMSMLYWIIYRNNVVCYASFLSIQHISDTSIFHIVSEMIETSIKLFEWYFNISSNIQRCIPWFRNSLLFDDCSYDQWYVRCSIDIMIRFTVELVNGLWVIYFLAILGKENYGETEGQVIKGMKYIAIPLGFDIIYFIIQSIISIKRYNHNIIVHCRCVWQKHSVDARHYFI